MSLINQMLKDLEIRTTQAAQADSPVVGLYSAAVRKKSKTKNYLFLLGLLAFAFVWTWNLIHYFSHQHSSFQTGHLQTRAAVKSAPPIRMPMAVIKKPDLAARAEVLVALTGISMQVHGKMTYLRFLFDRETLYQVNADPLQHSLIITLKNTHLTVNVPPLDFINSALKDLKISYGEKGELKLILILSPDAKLSNLELNKESRYPELQADFLMEAPVVVNQEKVVRMNKNMAEQHTGQLKKVAVALSVDEKYQEALGLVEAGQHDKAIQGLTVLVDKHPEYNLARETLVTLLVQQGNQGSAEKILSTGLQLQPYYPPFIEMKAHFLVDEGKIEQALNLLKKAPPALAMHPEYYAFIAALYQRLGQFSSAESLYQQLTALHPEKGVWWLGLAVTEEGLGKNAQAMEAYAKADRSPDLDPELRGYVGTRLRG